MLNFPVGHRFLLHQRNNKLKSVTCALNAARVGAAAGAKRFYFASL